MPRCWTCSCRCCRAIPAKRWRSRGAATWPACAGAARSRSTRCGRCANAIEPRHESFGSREAVALLRRHGVALVAADTAGEYPCFDEATAGFSYVRLHGGTQLYVSGYSKRELSAWARRIRRWAARGDVYCYFDNDAKVRAPFDALSLQRMLGVRAT